MLERNKLYLGDCLEVMKELDAGVVDLILCDLPYGTVKGIGSNGTEHGMVGKTEWDEIIPTGHLFSEYNRILRMNGAVVLFSQEPFTTHLIINAHKNMPFSYRMVWIKDHFANSLIAKKAPVSYYEDVLVFFKKYDTLAQHPLRKYAATVLDCCGGNLKDINNKLGHRKAEHFFYIESTQFGLCTEIVYKQICDIYKIDCQEWFKPYDELVEVDRRFSRRFNLPNGKKYKSNVLQYRKDYSGYHPTQKPVALVEDLIKTYSDEGDTVLDNCLGSGTTAIAALNTGRYFIGIEKDEHYYNIAQQRIQSAGGQQ